MPNTSQKSKQQRLERVLLLLKQYPEGLKELDIADMLGMERRTVYNYLQELYFECKIEKDGVFWYVPSFEKKIARPLDLPPDESVILYLAARLFVKQRDTRIELAETVLLKLADILSDDFRLGGDIRDAATQLASRPKNEHYEDIFRTIIRGYIYRHSIEITYHPYQARPFQTTFSPYLLEPSAIGFSTYAIGHSSIVNALRTYKLERITHARLLKQTPYEVPEDFLGLDLLQNAWSIYYGEATVQVVLRFHPDVARRVQETNWHPSQQLELDAEKSGYLLFGIEVADTTDLVPWIRGWGATCEVLEPTELRQQLMGEARRLAELYGWHTSTSDHTDNQRPDHSRFNDIFGD